MPLSTVMRGGEQGLFDKCEMYHSSLLWFPQSTIYGVFFELSGVKETTNATRRLHQQPMAGVNDAVTTLERPVDDLGQKEKLKELVHRDAVCQFVPAINQKNLE